ncbi:MAG: N-acetyltransferase [Epulopiscium sp.]|nr:N-acetyltransferase [Candidatus Epulonipiscium sp.]
MNILIRNEKKEDFRKVEELTREAFWNLYVPGCDEHYLVHVIREHPDFIADMDFVAILDKEIVGNIMFTKSRLVNEENESIDVLILGPVSVLPKYQKKGIGSKLIQHSIKKAIEKGYKVIVLEGHPYNYCKHGFKGSKSLNVSDQEGRYPYSLMVLELEEGFLKNHSWKYYPSNAYEIDENEAKEFDKQFPPKKKAYQPSQEEFNIACNAYIEDL